MTNSRITKLDMLLAVAMSSYYQTSHVMFIPPNTDYTHMLELLLETKDITHLGKTFYKTTKKGLDYIKRSNKTKFKGEDISIDIFVDRVISKL